jgi:hypothetical protein
MISDSIPFRRLGAHYEVAKAVAFFAPGDSSYITGTELFLDGGVAQVQPAFCDHKVNAGHGCKKERRKPHASFHRALVPTFRLGV